MAKIDKIKEFIGFLKAVFITAIVIMSSLIAYLYNKTIEEKGVRHHIVIQFFFFSFFIV